MDMTYTTTVSRKEEEALTIDKIKEAIGQLEKLTPIPKLYFCHYVPYNQIYHGDIVDEMVRRSNPFFNPRWHKAYLVNIQYEEMLTNHYSQPEPLGV